MDNEKTADEVIDSAIANGVINADDKVAAHEKEAAQNKKKRSPQTKESKLKKFTKAQLLDSIMFHNQKDLLNALLKEEETYTKDEVTVLLKEYARKEV